MTNKVLANPPILQVPDFRAKCRQISGHFTPALMVQISLLFLRTEIEVQA